MTTLLESLAHRVRASEPVREDRRSAVSSGSGGFVRLRDAPAVVATSYPPVLSAELVRLVEYVEGLPY